PGGDDRSAGARPTGFVDIRRQVIAYAERGAPGDPARIDVDRVQAAPGWLLTRQPAHRIPEIHITFLQAPETIPARRELLRACEVVGIDNVVTQSRVEGRAAPVGSAETAGEARDRGIGARGLEGPAGDDVLLL